MGQVPPKYFLPSSPYGASPAASALNPSQQAASNPQTPLLPPSFQDPGTMPTSALPSQALQGSLPSSGGAVNPYRQRNQMFGRGLFGAIALLLLSSLASATTTVTGNIKNLGTTSPSSGLYVRFWLRGCQGAQPRVNGTALIAPSQGGVFFQDFVADANGNISGSVYSTRNTAGTGNGEIECPTGVFTASWYGVQLFAAGRGGPETPVHAKIGATLNVTNATPLTSNPVVIAPTGDTTYVRLDGGNSPITGAIQINNSLTVSGTSGADIGKDNAVFVAGSTLYPTCQAAITAAGTTNKSIIVIRSDYAGAACPATIPENITVTSYDGVDRCNVLNSTPPCSSVNFNFDDTVVYTAEKHQMNTSHQDAGGAGTTLGLYSITTLMNATANNNSGIDGFSGEANTGGTLSGTFGNLQAHEADVTLRSTGGTVTNATAGIFYVNSTAPSTTAVTNVFGVRALGCNSIAGAQPTNCYGAFFSRQDTAGVGKASGRNYSFASEGPGIFQYNSSLGFGGYDCENTSHTALHCFFTNSSNQLIVRAVDATGGLQLQDSTSTTRAQVSSAGLTVSTALLPNATGVDVGSTSLPFQNLWLGTAATNNFKFQPAATAAARIISIPDPLGNTSLPLTIASGTKALNTASITTATCDAGVAATATGTLSTDAVDWSFNAAPTATNKYGAFLVVYAVPSANTVTFYTCNPSATTSTPTAMTVNWSVRRP